MSHHSDNTEENKVIERQLYKYPFYENDVSNNES